MLSLNDPQPFPVEDDVTEYKEEFNEKWKQEIAVFLNVKGTQANKYLKQLTDAEILKKVGGGPNTRYVLNRQILSE